MAEAFIVDALRTPTGRCKGSLAHVHGEQVTSERDEAGALAMGAGQDRLIRDGLRGRRRGHVIGQSASPCSGAGRT